MNLDQLLPLLRLARESIDSALGEMEDWVKQNVVEKMSICARGLQGYKKHLTRCMLHSIVPKTLSPK